DGHLANAALIGLLANRVAPRGRHVSRQACRLSRALLSSCAAEARLRAVASGRAGRRPPREERAETAGRGKGVEPECLICFGGAVFWPAAGRIGNLSYCFDRLCRGRPATSRISPRTRLAAKWRSAQAAAARAWCV